MAAMFRSFCGLGFAVAAVLASIIFSFPPRAGAAEAKRVLVLHSFGRDFAPWSEYAKAIRQQLLAQSPWPLDIQEQSVITARSSDDRSEAAFTEYLEALYAKSTPDLIIGIGAPAAQFVQTYRERLFAGTPMILAIVDQRRVKYSVLGPNDAVVAVAIDYHEAIKNILQVLPNTNHIAMVVGTSPIEQFWRKEIERESQPLENRVRFTWYDALSFADILKHAATLPPNSAIFWELMIVDAAGVVHEEEKALSRLRAVANAPIFSYTDAFFGHGIVGGPHVPVLEAGRQVGAAAVRLLGGESPATVKVPPIGMGVPRFDWRELQRWGIPESRLPPGSVVHFRNPTVWQQYRVYIIVVGAAILFQGLAIAWLLYEQRRRHFAEVTARRTLSELHRVNRLAAAGELSASIAHEVKQPLTTVAANAYAALNWLRASAPNIDEARKSLDQIVAAAHRANDIVSGIRAMFTKDETQTGRVDVNELILAVLNAGRVNLRAHQIELDMKLEDGLAPIEGNQVQLQQVILNLVTNAVEAMEGTDARILRVRSSRVEPDGIRITIEDTGSGLDPAELGRIFKPLFTTKTRGMGIGLSICRSVVEAHGGQIRAFSAPQGGATFEVDLPAQSPRSAVSSARMGD